MGIKKDFLVVVELNYRGLDERMIKNKFRLQHAVCSDLSAICWESIKTRRPAVQVIVSRNHVLKHLD